MTLKQKQERINQLLQVISTPLDELNGLLMEVLDETNILDDSGEEDKRTGFSSIQEFYMNLPVYSTLDEVRDSLEELVEHANK